MAAGAAKEGQKGLGDVEKAEYVGVEDGVIFFWTKWTSVFVR
jgi:hypothetical protein